MAFPYRRSFKKYGYGSNNPARTEECIFTVPNEIQLPLPKVGEEVKLGEIHGTCQVLKTESTPPYGMMYSLVCIHKGLRTTRGDTFKLNERAIQTYMREAYLSVLTTHYRQFRGHVIQYLASLGPDKWLTFLEWFAGLTHEVLLQLPREHEESEATPLYGKLGELWNIHRLVARAAEQSVRSGESVSYRIKLKRDSGCEITTTIPNELIVTTAQTLPIDLSHPEPWREYRRFIAWAMPRLTMAVQSLLQVAVTRQEQWLRSRNDDHLRPLNRSDTEFLTACKVSQPSVSALIHKIEIIKVDEEEVAFSLFFVGAIDQEKIRCVARITRYIHELRIRPTQWTIAQKHEARRAVNETLNEGMPEYLHTEVSDARMEIYTEEAAETCADGIEWVDNTLALEQEAARVYESVVRNRWNFQLAAQEFGLTEGKLKRYTQQRGLADTLRTARHTRVLSVYTSTLPDARRSHDIEYPGVAAVIDQLGLRTEENQAPLGKAETWIRQAFEAQGRLESKDFSKAKVEGVLRQTKGAREAAAKVLNIRLVTLHHLLDQHNLWHQVIVAGRSGDEWLLWRKGS